MIAEPGCADQIDIKKEEIMVERVIHMNSSSYEFNENMVKEDDLIQECHSAANNQSDDNKKTRSNKRMKFPAWFRAKLLECRILKQTDEEMGNQWSCCICENKTFLTITGLRLHLVNSHYPDLKKSHIENSEVSANLKGENTKYERNPEWIKEMVQKSKDPVLPHTWNCCICKRVTISTALGIQLHIVRMHCEARKLVPKTNKTFPKHEHDPNWINEMVEKSDTHTDGWNCVICKSVSAKTEWGIRLHIILMHCKRNQNTGTPQKNTIHDDGHSWIKEVIEQSKNSDESYTCSICHNYTNLMLRSIRMHIFKAHGGQQNNPINNIPDDVSEWSENSVSYEEEPTSELDDDYSRNVKLKTKRKEKKWLRKAIQESTTSVMTSEGRKKKWTCSICKNFSSRTGRGMMLHIVRMHHRTKKRFDVTKVNNGQSSNREQVKAGTSQFHQKNKGSRRNY